MWQTKQFKQIAGVLVILVAAYYALGAYENYLNIKKMKQGKPINPNNGRVFEAPSHGTPDSNKYGTKKEKPPIRAIYHGSPYTHPYG